MVPVQLVALALGSPLARRLPMLWHRLLLALLGVRVRRRGALAGAARAGRPLLLVANHVSWFDIVVLGALAPLSFVAKDEVRALPVLGWLARLQRSLFVARDRRRDSPRQVSELAARLRAGETLVLFAEGTTGDGHRLRPFKSTLFAALEAALAEAPDVTVQPVALAYVALHGLPLGRLHMARIAWPGDVPLGSHLRGVLEAGAWDAEIVLCPPFELERGVSRKRIARQAEAAVRAAYGRAVRFGHVD